MNTHGPLRLFISIAIYPEICRYDDQAFDDMSEESGKKNIVKKQLWPVPSQGIVEQAKFFFCELRLQ